MKSITVKELNAIINDVKVIDVRSKSEYENGHVPSAINLPLDIISMHNKFLNKRTPYFVICKSGMRSARAYQFLESKGYNVTNVKGGTDKYKKKFKIVTK